MKKLLFIVASALFSSCKDSKPTYTKCVETTYNFNKEATNKVVGTDTKEGGFTVEISAESIKITDNTGKETVLNSDNGYSLTNKKSGDTLVIENLPTDNTPSEVLKFGTTYKFYN
ncbi:hypothetical protein [Flavobacterium oreochromis]|uniref:Lipoprotein n=1 Tax=Flavobacterium columnare TaxID=996 RepID=A0A246GA96_9FLAO|nr:hypothetical protein [Flavobacterium oreochromis]OWP76856.1 hypothetical protein BWK62_08695 [Flavobacterium oreochromis]